MKPFLALIACFLLGACTADYDTFDASDYGNLNEIHFAEEVSNPSVYASERKILVTLAEAPDSLTFWDSLTISEVDMSNLASIHLVESVVREFPQDSSAWDSLANAVAYASKSLKIGKKLRVPESRKIYVAVVSESGKVAVWQISFQLQNADLPSSSSEIAVSSSSAESSSSEAVKSSLAELNLVFKNQLKENRFGDTIAIKLIYGSSLDSAVLESYRISERAKVSPVPDSVDVWAAVQNFSVTAEDGSVRLWTLILEIADENEKALADKELLSISAEGEVSPATVDSANKTVVLHLKSSTAAAKALVSVEISASAHHDLTSPLDLRTPKRLTIFAEDGSSVEWTLSASVEFTAPRIRGISIGTGNIEGRVDSLNGEIFFEMDYRTDLDLRHLKVQGISLSDGAQIEGLKEGESYDFSRAKEVSVVNDVGESETYRLQAGYAYPNSDFNTWTKDAFDNRNDVDYWDNGNNSAISATKTLTVSDAGETVVKMESKDAKILGVGRFASGNMLVAYFNPNNVSTLNMTKYDDGNELIDFGRPFYGRPQYVEFDVKYEGLGDSCDLYVLLENRSRTSNEGKNQYRTSSDVNTLVASAWYRDKTVNSTEDPDVVNIRDATRAGYKTIRLKFKYGKPHSNSPIYNSSVFTASLKNSAGIDNHLVETDSPEEFDVTHIRVVMASSALGNLYKGSVGATLYCDEMRLIY